MKRILITGANKGIGLASVAAVLAADRETAVLLGARDEARGRAALEELCHQNPDWVSRLEVLQIDVSSESSVLAARDALAKRHGAEPAPLYGLVNNAGIGLGSDAMRSVLEVNTLGVKRVCDAFLPLLAPAGRVVVVSSASGPKYVSECSPRRQAFFQDPGIEWPELERLLDQVIGLEGDAAGLGALGLPAGNAYGLSKACASLYTLMLARDHPHLRVNACTPGYIETDMTRPQAEARGATPADMGMKPATQGTVSILFLLLGEPQGSGHYYGSDALRSPLDSYRAPGSPEYTGP